MAVSSISGIELIGEFEGPAGGLGIGPLDAPIALAPDLLADQPIGRPASCARRRGCPASPSANAAIAVSQIGETHGWKMKRSSVSISSDSKCRMASSAVRMVRRIAQRVERHDEVHHRRIDGAQPFGVVRAGQNPVLRLANRGAANSLAAALLPDLEDAVQVVEENASGPLRFGKRRLTPGSRSSSSVNPAGARRLDPRACTIESGTRMERVHDDIS